MAADIKEEGTRLRESGMKTGGDVLCATLEALGIECVFGLPGTQTVELYEAIRRSRIRSILATNELAAGFMANGYYKASGRIAPLITIPGAGFTWALTAVAEALHDSVALVHIVPRMTADDPRAALGIDQAATARPLVKGSFAIRRADEIPDVVPEAFALAGGGEPGPVLLEYAAVALGELSAAGPAIPPLEPLAAAPLSDELLDAVSRATRPLLLAGQGCVDASAELTRLAGVLRAPVFTTGAGRGVIAEDHPLALCFDIERGNTESMNRLIEESDCVLAIGCKLSYSGTGAFRLRLPEDKLIRVDTFIDRADSRYPARYTAEQPAEVFIPRLLDGLSHPERAERSTWTEAEVQSWRERLRETDPGIPEPLVGQGADGAAGFFADLRDALPRDAIVVSDSGLHQQLLRRHFDVLSARGLMLPSDYQSMGFAIPAAIGARLAAGERRIVAVVGDGGFVMTGFELLTAAREGAPIVLVILNDGKLGRIRNEQVAAFGREASVDLTNPNFQAMAEAMGARYSYYFPDRLGEFRAALGHDGVSVIEVAVSDSAAMRTARIRGLARGEARRFLGADVAGKLREVIGRRN